MNSTEAFLKNVIKGGIFILPFLPFLVTDSLFFPFITGKTFVFRIIIELLLIVWVALVLRNRSYLPGRSVLLWALLIFFVVVGLSTAFSLNPSKSFFSNAERMEGMFGLLHILALFIMTAGVFKERDWIQFFFVTLVASVGVAIHGLGQIVGWYDTHQGTRVDSNFGNSTYFAMYAVFMVFFSLMMAYRARRGHYVPLAEGKGRVFQWFFVFLALSYTALLYVNATRGALLGLFGGLFLTTLLISLFGRGKGRKVSLVLFLLLLLTPILFLSVKNTSFVQESPTLRRFADISVTEQTTESRLTIWGMAYDAWKERPVLGYGMENFTTIFAQYYEPKLWKQEPWFDRTHNVPIDWLISAGILGLLTYLSLYVLALYLIYKGFKKGHFSSVQAALLVGLLAAHFVHNLFVFDYLVSYIFFFATLAYIHVMTREKEGSDKPLVSQTLSQNFILAVVALVMLVSVYAYNVRPIQAAALVIDALQQLVSPQVTTTQVSASHEAFKKAIEKGTFITPEAREQIGIKAQTIASSQTLGEEVPRNYVDYAEAEFEKQLTEAPHDFRARTFLSALYISDGKLTRGKEIAEELIERAPTRPLFYFLLGQALWNEENFDEAVKVLKEAYELAPDWPDAQENYAAALIYADRMEEANAFMQDVFGTEHPPMSRVIKAYVDKQLLEDAMYSLEALVEKDPSNLQSRITLARLYVRFFMDQKAIEQLEALSKLDPRLEQTMNTLISQIRDGTINRNF